MFTLYVYTRNMESDPVPTDDTATLDVIQGILSMALHDGHCPDWMRRVAARGFYEQCIRDPRLPLALLRRAIQHEPGMSMERRVVVWNLICERTRTPPAYYLNV